MCICIHTYVRTYIHTYLPTHMGMCPQSSCDHCAQFISNLKYTCQNPMVTPTLRRDQIKLNEFQTKSKVRVWRWRLGMGVSENEVYASKIHLIGLMTIYIYTLSIHIYIHLNIWLYIYIICLYISICIYIYTRIHQYTSIPIYTISWWWTRSRFGWHLCCGGLCRWEVWRDRARRDQARRYGYNDGKDNGAVFKTPLGWCL